MKIELNRFPEGRKKALTMSYDDGLESDIRLIQIFNKYGIKGTFHINGGLFGYKEWNRLEEGQIREVYDGHEISGHGYTHRKLTTISNEEIISEIMRDRAAIEKIIKKPLRGMSYPFGNVDENVKNILRICGIEYSRVVSTTGTFDIPQDFLEWKGTCHQGDKLLERGEHFLKQKAYDMMLMYVWGHSFEFDSEESWNQIEAFCYKMSGNNEIWYATNIEICDYVKAVRNLKFTVDQNTVWNPAMFSVWISVDGEPVEVEAGQVLKLN